MNYKSIDLQIILIGNLSVGKTCIYKRFMKNKFELTHSTVGSDMDFCKIEIKDNQNSVVAKRRITIWDTAGQERFDSLSNFYYQRAEGVILIYDVTNYLSFESCVEWIKKIKDVNNKKINYILVGNKIDDEEKRKVPTKIGQHFAMNNDMEFIEVSAKTGENIDKIFEILCVKCYSDILSINKELQIEELSGSFKLESIKTQLRKKEESSCCSII